MVIKCSENFTPDKAPFSTALPTYPRTSSCMPPQGNITPPADVSIYTSTLDNPGNAEDYNSASESEYDPANDFEVENINGNDGGLVDDCVQASTLEEPT